MSKHIAIITPGGDAPGMNSCLRAVVRNCAYYGYKTTGIKRGYAGLLGEDFISLNRRSVSGIINLGGTILKSARCREIQSDEGIKKAAGILKKNLFDYMVIIGGDGSIKAGSRISKCCGVSVIGIPASIDNDVNGTEETIGFDTAIDTAIEAVDKIRDTATSFERVFLIEVMGREHGYLALNIGLASGAEMVLIPEKKFVIRDISASLKKMHENGKQTIIIIFAEGAGDVNEVAKKIGENTGLEVRVSSLGYIQRGGSPSARSRILGTQFGDLAVNLIRKGLKNKVVVIQKGKISYIDIKKVSSREKKFDFSMCGLIEKMAQ